jgi:A/G-specific adenine glycosylase
MGAGVKNRDSPPCDPPSRKVSSLERELLLKYNMKNDFTKNLLAWFHAHGRHDLPWQQNPTPYRVWVSEIMLQQTQVSTVINYYHIFMNSFSSIRLLSEAHQDEVLSLWSGLGYYARARNLHRCAQTICDQHDGIFPQTVNELAELPGIGRSTAGAILSFSMNIRAPILDGNVKRVLARYYAIEGVTNDSAIIKQLWDTAEQLTPAENYAQYNQAIMDLGATICTRHKPACERCPVISSCQAYAQSRTQEFPLKKMSRSRPRKSTQMLIVKDTDGRIFLEKRPPAGIWGGLWGFPECESGEEIAAWCSHHLNAEVLTTEIWPAFSHAFSHFELMIHPVLITVKRRSGAVMEANTKIWYDFRQQLPGGVASPISKLLKQLKGSV